MTKDEIDRQIRAIKKVVMEYDDYEAAASMESKLYRDVLCEVAKGKLSTEDASALCRAALVTQGICFSRFFA